MIAEECARLGRDAADGEGLLYQKSDVKGMRPARIDASVQGDPSNSVACKL